MSRNAPDTLNWTPSFMISVLDCEVCTTYSSTHLYPWVERSNYCKVSCSRTQVSRPGFKPTLRWLNHQNLNLMLLTRSWHNDQCMFDIILSHTESTTVGRIRRLAVSPSSQWLLALLLANWWHQSTLDSLHFKHSGIQPPGSLAILQVCLNHLVYAHIMRALFMLFSLHKLDSLLCT